MRNAILTAFLAVFATVGGASADGPSCDDEFELHCTDACSNWARISKSDSTCLSAGWDNSPSASTGYGLGSTFWARNECASYGDLVVQIDLKLKRDEHAHLNDSTKVSSGDIVADVRDISCCIDRSNLCWKDQVEKHTSGDREGEVRVVRVLSSSYEAGYISVATHEDRWELCNGEHSQWKDTIYCRKNPERDAHIDPATVPLADGSPRCSLDSSCNCGDHYCTATDCKSQWDSSTPVSYGLINDGGMSNIHGCAPSNDSDYSSYFSAAIDASDGTSQTCTMRVVCGVGDRRNTYVNGAWRRETTVKWVEFTADVEDVDRYYNCAGVLYKTSCGSAVTSTHIEDITHTTIE